MLKWLKVTKKWLTIMARLGVHNQTFRDQTVSQTSLSKHIHNLEAKNITYKITWRKIGKGRPYTPSSKMCPLCDCEKFNILFHPEIADLNRKSEFYSHCMHIKPQLLVKREKKKGPGWSTPLGFKSSFKICWCIMFMFSYSSKPEDSRPPAWNFK